MRCWLLLPLLSGACAAPPLPETEGREESEILESCCRWFLADSAQRGSRPALVFVADLQGVGAPWPLLQRLANFGCDVLPASRSVEGRNGTMDRETGKRGAVLRVRTINRHPEHIEAHFEAYSGMEGSEGATLILVRDAPGWCVKEARNRWIS